MKIEKKSIPRGVNSYDPLSQGDDESLTTLIKSNCIDSTNTTTLADLSNSSGKSQFSLTHPSGKMFELNKFIVQQVKRIGTISSIVNGTS